MSDTLESLTYHIVDCPVVVAPVLIHPSPALGVQVAPCDKNGHPRGEGGIVLLVVVGRLASESTKRVLLFTTLLVTGIITVRVFVATKITVEADFCVGLFTCKSPPFAAFLFSERLYFFRNRCERRIVTDCTNRVY